MAPADQLRNRLIHAYDLVDFEQVVLVIEELPTLVASLEVIIGDSASR